MPRTRCRKRWCGPGKAWIASTADRRCGRGFTASRPTCVSTRLPHGADADGRWKRDRSGPWGTRSKLVRGRTGWSLSQTRWRSRRTGIRTSRRHSSKASRSARCAIPRGRTRRCSRCRATAARKSTRWCRKRWPQGPACDASDGPRFHVRLELLRRRRPSLGSLLDGPQRGAVDQFTSATFFIPAPSSSMMSRCTRTAVDFGNTRSPRCSMNARVRAVPMKRMSAE